MDKMMFVSSIHPSTLSLRRQVSGIAGVVAVFDFDPEEPSVDFPDFVLITSSPREQEVRLAIMAIMPEARISSRTILVEPLLITEVPWTRARDAQIRAATPRLITTADIPGTVPARPAMKVASAPIITRVPGMPSSNSAVVHRDFSSQAGLASFCIGGLNHLGELAEI